MAESVHQPHDKLFKQVFSDPAETEAFLQAYLPAELATQIDWATLDLINASFIDEEFQKRESDILFGVKHKATQEDAYLYLLFEHQSTPDKWMRLRIFYYMYCIWVESFKETADQESLRPVLPVVFYQGKDGWAYSTDFIDLFPTYAADWGFVPRFRHFLVDQSGMAPADVKGEPKAKVLQLLMLAAFHEPIEEALHLAAELLPQLTSGGGTNFVRVFYIYVLTTQGQERAEDFAEVVRKKDLKIIGLGSIKYTRRHSSAM